MEGATSLKEIGNNMQDIEASVFLFAPGFIV